MSEGEVTSEVVAEPALGDGQCLERIKGLLNCATTFAKCIQNPSIRGDIQRLRVEMRKVNEDEEAKKVLNSIADCLGNASDNNNVCGLLASLLNLCPKQPEGVVSDE